MFKALADPTRRELLDVLFREDGQPLNALVRRFSMTRIGLAKHLQLLEDAGLVVTKRRGREKLHDGNVIPVQLIHDRWVSKYTQGWTSRLADLKHDLEHDMEKVFEIYIRTTPERLWDAITNPDIRAKYNFGSRIESDWTPGWRSSRWSIPTWTGCSAKARTSKSTRHDASCKRCVPSGVPRSSRKAPAG